MHEISALQYFSANHCGKKYIALFPGFPGDPFHTI